MEVQTLEVSKWGDGNPRGGLHTHTDLFSNPQLEDTNLQACKTRLETLELRARQDWPSAALEPSVEGNKFLTQAVIPKAGM